jgi:hypothetical protein
MDWSQKKLPQRTSHSLNLLKIGRDWLMVSSRKNVDDSNSEFGKQWQMAPRGQRKQEIRVGGLTNGSCADGSIRAFPAFLPQASCSNKHSARASRAKSNCQRADLSANIGNGMPRSANLLSTYPLQALQAVRRPA